MQKSISMTKRTFSRTLMALLLIPTLNSINAYAESNEHNGTVQFSGAIVHTPCLNEVSSKHVTLNCLDDNADMTTSNIDLNKLVKTEGWKKLNGGRSLYSYDWLNEDKQLGMLTIKYS
ncbi:hypothetical protein GKR50_11855 [Providencia rustigianii]|uniref:hypothetical protein n=1 Tax=Providencia rustigianii TaxID=158850 RepID=UPI000F6E9543|nr:hypothetical protein [Providencia rustigianii]MTC60708.1 hypothetical protein [Providencia rustigianii]VEH57078.1 Uncharacterised protein [Providencia rustigianii]